MSEPERLDLLARFDRHADHLREVIARFADAGDVDALAAEAREAFAALEPEVPYADRPDHVMFGAAFGVYRFLAMWQAARSRGYDVHAVGRAICGTPVPARPLASGPALAKLRADAEASGRKAAANEFVFEFVEGDGETDWGMNVTSCAVCHAYGRHDAMDLVPYLCAIDDVDSTAGDHGLRRTGTIALGAQRCDFRFKRGGTPAPLAPQYPGQIRPAADAE
jgi:hypothetical protein